MNVLRLLRKALCVLRIEDETYLAYLYGHKIDQHEYLRTRECKMPGLFIRCLFFLRYLQKNYKKYRTKNKK